MSTRTYDSAPGTLGLYARAALPLVPLASRLPFVPGHGDAVPDLRLELSTTVDRDHLAAYARVCSFALRDTLPATYPHMLAFPLHMKLMTDGSFPFAPVGLVHIENTITVRRPIRVVEPLDIAVYPSAVSDHPRGKQFTLITEARVADELVWSSESTMLRRGKGTGERGPREVVDPPPATATWRLPGDLGRRYAAVSGDRNPIHMSDLTARLFGFPRAIAHGMWTKARCLAALESRLPDAYTVSTGFKKPILLPAKVAFGFANNHFAVRSASSEQDVLHLEGSIE